jgi:multidrug efflux pump subunit AcrB
MGKDLSINSMFGIDALNVVVVNDSLLLIDFVNQKRKQGIDMFQAVVESAQRRFRPIVLTSLTTSLGLTPIILEKSVQAQFLIPMAISLGFGILFATFITLLLVPSLYVILEDFLKLFLKADTKQADIR